MKELNFAEFLENIEAHEHVAFTAPAYGDGDSVGTQCALREMILQRYPEKKVSIINEMPCPKRFEFLNQSSHFQVSKDVLSLPETEHPQLMICVDGNFERIGQETAKLWEKAQKGQVDHHAMSGENVYDFRLYDSEAASTTEIVFRLLKDQNFQITQTIAQAIYVGLIFDTGLFKHSNAKPETLMIGAELMKTEFDHTDTAEKAMLIRSEGSFSLLKEVLAKSTFEIEGRYVWSEINYEAFQKLSGDSDDREGLIDHLFLTEQCEIAALFFEVEPKHWKLSFRARGPWDVAALARQLNPEGGGHVKAAGCGLDGSAVEVQKKCHHAVFEILGSKKSGT